MREINAAYALILQSGVPLSTSTGAASGREAHASRRPLTRDEIERMVQAIGTAGPVETAFDAFRSAGSAIWTLLGVVAVVVMGVRLVVALHGRDWAALRSEPHMAIYPLLAGACLLAWYWQRRQQEHE